MDEMRARGSPLSHRCRSPRAKRLVSYESLAKFMRYSVARFLIFFPFGLFGAKIQKSSKMVAFGHFPSNLDIKYGVRSVLSKGIQILW